MTVTYLWHTLRRRAWLILLALLVGSAIALWYTLAQPATYAAEATISIASTNPSASPGAAIELADSLAPTLVVYMGTQTFAAQVLARTELSMSPAMLLTSVTTWHVPETPLLKIRAVSNYPQQAERTANGVAETMIAITNEQAAAKAANPFLRQSQAESLLQATQDELQYYLDLQNELKTRLAEYRAQAPSEKRDEGIMRLADQVLAVQQTISELRNSLMSLHSSGMGGGQPYSLLLLDPATVPVVPLPRPLLRNLLLGLVFSLLVGVLLALVPDSLDNTVSTPEELEELLDMTTLGAIARLGRSQANEDPVELLVARNYPRSPIAEAFRTLRTNIKFARPDTQGGTILITSARPGEGKSLVAANLAVAIAQEGRKAIVIDADLRRPSLHRFFGIPNRIGFTSLIMDETLDIDDALQDTDVPNLRVITSGPLPPNPLDMLASKRAAQLLREIKAHCDTLIFDSPPVLSVTDALLLAEHAEAALLVTAARQTRRDAIVKALDTLRRSGVDVIGSILNKVRETELGYYYSHYYYGYYYGSPGEIPEEIPVVGRMQGAVEGAAKET